MIRCRVIRDTKNRDGYILRAIETGQVGFINPEAIPLVNAGQIWDCQVSLQTDRYFKAILRELIPFKSN